ncbi:MAG: hypothetical protein HY302_00115 [Opitutae bacterium]|nr:hypothetical protein [Opitutae bacterium]
MPVIATPLRAQLVTTGGTVSFFAPGTSGTVQWQISTDGGATFTNLANNATFSGVTTRTLTVSNAGAGNGALYRYVLTAPGGSVASNAARLTVAEAFFPMPVALATDAAGNFYVADSASDTIQRFTNAGEITLVAGTAGQAGSADGTGAAARFNDPSALAVAPDGTVFVADTANATLRRISAAGVVTTLAGSATARGNTDGPGAQATFSAPAGLARDAAGVLFVADSATHTIRRVAADGTVSTFAGLAGAAGTADGTGAAARFNRPTGLALDASGNLFVADTTNNTLRRITPAGAVTTLAGLAGVSGSTDGTGSGALFNGPAGVAVNGAGNVLVADTGNSTIRQITPAGTVTTVAGLSGIAGLTDGTGADAWFNQPRALVAPGGEITVADTGNAALRRIAAGGVVTTLQLARAAAPPPAVTPPAPAAPPPASSGGGGGAPGAAFSILLPLLLLLARRARESGAGRPGR